MSDQKLPDFASMANQSRAQHQQKLAEETAKREADRRRIQEIFDADVKFLEDNVAPILEEAARQFEAVNVPCEIGRNWTNEHGIPMNAQMDFKCIGPERRNKHGGKSTPRSGTGFFSYSLGTLKVGFAKEQYSRSPDRHQQVDPKTPPSEVIPPVIQEVIDSYYASITALEKQGLW